MPYIPKEHRPAIDKKAWELSQKVMSEGELNYAVCRLIVHYLPEDAHYFNYNQVMGVLECVKQEIYRRMVAPYENEKMMVNGDVFDKVVRHVDVGEQSNAPR